MAQWRVMERDNTKERYIELVQALINGYYDFPRLYKNYGAVQVTHQHPFALLSMQANAQLTGIFPCVSVNIPEESEDVEVLNFEQDEVDIDTAWCDSLLALPDEKRAVSKERLNEIRAAVVTAGTPLTAVRNTKRIKQTLTCAIWATHFAIRDALYQACRSCFIQHRKELEEEGFGNWVVSGASDLYNTEFGNMLFGGEVRAVGTNYTVDYLIDTTWEELGQMNITGTPVIRG